MQPGQGDLDRGACLTMLLVQLALGKPQAIADVTGFRQLLLGVIDSGLQFDQCRRCGRSSRGEVRTKNVPVNGDGDEIGQYRDKAAGCRQVIDQDHLAQQTVHCWCELVGYVDDSNGVLGAARKSWPLLYPLFGGQSAKQQAGPSQILTLEMVERANGRIDASYGN